MIAITQFRFTHASAPHGAAAKSQQAAAAVFVSVCIFSRGPMPPVSPYPGSAERSLQSLALQLLCALMQCFHTPARLVQAEPRPRHPEDDSHKAVPVLPAPPTRRPSASATHSDTVPQTPPRIVYTHTPRQASEAPKAFGAALPPRQEAPEQTLQSERKAPVSTVEHTEGQPELAERAEAAEISSAPAERLPMPVEPDAVAASSSAPVFNEQQLTQYATALGHPAPLSTLVAEPAPQVSLYQRGAQDHREFARKNAYEASRHSEEAHRAAAEARRLSADAQQQRAQAEAHAQNPVYADWVAQTRQAADQLDQKAAGFTALAMQHDERAADFNAASREQEDQARRFEELDGQAPV